MQSCDMLQSYPSTEGTSYQKHMIIILFSVNDFVISLSLQQRVVDLVKKNKAAVTLAVGDGANDVGMIKGVCISPLFPIIIIKFFTPPYSCPHRSRYQWKGGSTSRTGQWLLLWAIQVSKLSLPPPQNIMTLRIIVQALRASSPGARPVVLPQNDLISSLFLLQELCLYLLSVYLCLLLWLHCSGMYSACTLLASSPGHTHNTIIPGPPI